VAEALIAEYGFAPSRLKEIVILEADNMSFHIQFRIGKHHYTFSHGTIERTNDKGAAV
jgi:hypothetical protein